MKEPQMMEITTLVEANSAGARIAAVAIEYSEDRKSTRLNSSHPK